MNIFLSLGQTTATIPAEKTITKLKTNIDSKKPEISILSGFTDNPAFAISIENRLIAAISPPKYLPQCSFLLSISSIITAVTSIASPYFIASVAGIVRSILISIMGKTKGLVVFSKYAAVKYANPNGLWGKI